MSKVPRLNDNTFFILLAIIKQDSLYIERFSNLYKYESYNEVLKDLSRLIEIGLLNFNFYYFPLRSGNLDLIEKLHNNQEVLENIVERINSNAQKQRPLDENIEYSPIVTQLLNILGCNITLATEDKEEFLTAVNEYFIKQETQNKFYSFNKHYEILKAYLNGDGKNTGSPYKARLSKFTLLINDYEQYRTRYNFFHFFKALEDKKIIQIFELKIQEEEPVIIFDFIRKRKVKEKEKPEGKPIGSFTIFTLYKNGLTCSKNGEFIHTEPLDNNLLKHCFNKKTKTFTYQELAGILMVGEKEVPRRIYNSNNLIRKLTQNKRTKIFLNNETDKSYDLKFTE